MKKILWTILFFGLLVFVSLAQAETEWRPTNQATLTWNEPTLLSDMISPIPSGDTVTFNTYVKNEDGSGQTLVAGNSQCCSYTYSFLLEGRYYIGVSVVRLTPTGVTTESPISWSDDVKHTTGGIVFGYQHYFTIQQPSGLSPQ